MHPKTATSEGFTLIELLVVIIIIGILSAIALPSFLNQANKAKQAEAKTYTGTLNRVQQAHYLEKSQFAANLVDLANPVPSQTENYTYTFSPVPDSALSVISYGTSRKDALKSYAGMVAVSVVEASSDATTTAVLCESNTPGSVATADPIVPPVNTADQPTCAEGSKKL